MRELVEGQVAVFREGRVHILRSYDEVCLPGDGDSVGEPARLPAHGLDDEVAPGRDGVRAEVHQFLGEHVDRGEEPEGEVDAPVVVVDGLGHVNDGHALGLRREVPLEMMQVAGRGERSVATDADQRVDAEVDERRVDVLEPRRLGRIVEVLGTRDARTRVRPARSDEDAAGVPQVRDVPLRQQPVVFVGHEAPGDRMVFHQVRIPVEEADDLALVLHEGVGRGGDHGVGAGRGTSAEHDADAARPAVVCPVFHRSPASDGRDPILGGKRGRPLCVRREQRPCLLARGPALPSTRCFRQAGGRVTAGSPTRGDCWRGDRLCRARGVFAGRGPCDRGLPNPRCLLARGPALPRPV